VKNEVGALATSIIYEPKAFSVAELGADTSRLQSQLEINIQLISIR
jgi:hypothetical protein